MNGLFSPSLANLPGAPTIAALVHETFGISADTDDIPPALRRYADYALLRLHADENDAAACAKLDAAIQAAVREYAAGRH